MGAVGEQAVGGRAGATIVEGAQVCVPLWAAEGAGGRERTGPGRLRSGERGKE